MHFRLRNAMFLNSQWPLSSPCSCSWLELEPDTARQFGKTLPRARTSYHRWPAENVGCRTNRDNQVNFTKPYRNRRLFDTEQNDDGRKGISHFLVRYDEVINKQQSQLLKPKYFRPFDVDTKRML